MVTNNAANAQNAQYNLIVGTGSAYTNIAPSATSGVPLISQGAASNPAYGTAVVAGGGTGVTSNTSYAVLCGGTTSTGALQSVASVGTSGQVLTSNGAGALPTFQGYCGFSVYQNTTINDVTGDSTVYTIPYNTVLFDSNSGYSTVTGIYTIPKSGKWYFSMLNVITGITTNDNMNIRIVCSTGTIFQGGVSAPTKYYATGNSVSTTCFGFVSLSANDTVKTEVTVYGGAKVVDVAGDPVIVTGFSGYLVGV